MPGSSSSTVRAAVRLAAEEGGGYAQALAHAEGEFSDALRRYPGQAGHLDDLADPGGLDVVGGGHGAQV
jgi:hypothetical protein